MKIDRIVQIKKLDNFSTPEDYFEYHGKLYPIYYSDFDDNGIRKAYLYDLTADQYKIIIKYLSGKLFFTNSYIELVLRTYYNAQILCQLQA